MPYEMAEYLENKKAYEQYYDEVEICPESCESHPKAAYRIRNRSMVDRSDLVVFYVTRNHGGAYQTMQYAQRKGKRIINLAAEICKGWRESNTYPFADFLSRANFVPTGAVENAYY